MVRLNKEEGYTSGNETTSREVMGVVGRWQDPPGRWWWAFKETKRSAQLVPFQHFHLMTSKFARSLSRSLQRIIDCRNVDDGRALHIG